MAQISFNPGNVSLRDGGGSGGYTPVPAGRYWVEVVESDIRQTKSGTGEYIYLVLRIVEGPYENRKIFDRLNYVNQNRKTQMIAQQALHNLCHSVGIYDDLGDTSRLHFKPLQVSVSIKPDTGFGEQNAVRYSAPVAQRERLPLEAPRQPLPAQTNPYTPQSPAQVSPFSPPPPRPTASRNPPPRPDADKPWQKAPKF